MPSKYLGASLPSRKMQSALTYRDSSDSELSSPSSPASPSSRLDAPCYTVRLPSSTSIPQTKPGTKSHARKRPLGHIPRPRNAFILFRCALVAQKSVPTFVESNHRNISRIAGSVWQAMSEEDKRPWIEMAHKEKKAHAKKYPDYRYTPVPYTLARPKTPRPAQEGAGSVVGSTCQSPRHHGSSTYASSSPSGQPVSNYVAPKELVLVQPSLTWDDPCQTLPSPENGSQTSPLVGTATPPYLSTEQPTEWSVYQAGVHWPLHQPGGVVAEPHWELFDVNSSPAIEAQRQADLSGFMETMRDVPMNFAEAKYRIPSCSPSPHFQASPVPDDLFKNEMERSSPGHFVAPFFSYQDALSLAQAAICNPLTQIVGTVSPEAVSS